MTRSDVILAGAVIGFQLRVLKGGGLTESILRDILSYGQFMGLGQWRSGGWGRFLLKSLTSDAGRKKEEEEEADEPVELE